MSKSIRTVLFVVGGIVVVYLISHLYFWYSDYNKIKQIKSDFVYLENYYKTKNTYPTREEFYSKLRTPYVLSNAYNYHDPESYKAGYGEGSNVRNRESSGFGLSYKLWFPRREAIGDQWTGESFLSSQAYGYSFTSCDIGGACWH